MRGDWGLRATRVLKVALPLAALVLLSLVFLLARSVDPSQAIRSARVDVADLARDPRISGATYAGVTSDGSELAVAAEVVRTDPLAMTRLDAEGIAARLARGAGQVTEFAADSGWIDQGEGTLGLLGGVRIVAEPGYRLETPRLVARLDRTLAEAPEGVAGAAPAGTIRADALEIVSDPAVPGRNVLVFNGAVRLIYLPPVTEE